MTVAHWAQRRAKCVARLPIRAAQTAIDTGDKALYIVPRHIVWANSNLRRAQMNVNQLIDDMAANINRTRVMLDGLLADQDAA